MFNVGVFIFLVTMIFGFNSYAQTTYSNVIDHCNTPLGEDAGWSHLENKEAAFIRATSKVDIGCLFRILPELQDGEINVQDKNGDTALTLLMKNPNEVSLVAARELVLYPELDFTIKNNDGISAIDLAQPGEGIEGNRVSAFILKEIEERSKYFISFIKNMELDNVKRAVLAGANPNAVDEDGYSALMLAAGTHWVSVIDTLLSSRLPIDVNYSAPNGKTALMESIFYYRNLVALLNQPEINLNIQNFEGDTALHLAIKNSVPRDVIDTLIKMQPTDLTITNYEGHTALSLANSLGDIQTISSLKQRLVEVFHSAIIEGDESKINIIAKDIENAQVDFPETDIDEVFTSVDGSGKSLLMNAVLSKNSFSINFLTNGLFAFTDFLNYSNPTTGATALTLASQTENVEAVSVFVNLRATRYVLNKQDNSGFSPIMYAAKNGNVNIAKQLLNTNKIDFSLLDTDGNSVWDIAVENENEEVFDVLINAYQENLNNLLLASESGDMEMFDVYRNGINLNFRSEEGKTALIVAAENGNTRMVSALLEFVDVEINTMTQSGLTPLIAATKNNHPNTVKALLENSDTFLDLRGEGGKTALMWAFELGHFDIIQVLSEYGANFNIQDKVLGNTAIMFGILSKRTPILKKVLDMVEPATIDLSIQNNDGIDALQMAEENRLLYTLKLLEEYKEASEEALAPWYRTIAG